MIIKKVLFLEVRLNDKYRVNFHSVAMKDKPCTVRLLAKFEFPAPATNKTGLNKLLLGQV